MATALGSFVLEYPSMEPLRGTSQASHTLARSLLPANGSVPPPVLMTTTGNHDSGNSTPRIEHFRVPGTVLGASHPLDLTAPSPKCSRLSGLFPFTRDKMHSGGLKNLSKKEWQNQLQLQSHPAAQGQSPA